MEPIATVWIPHSNVRAVEMHDGLQLEFHTVASMAVMRDTLTTLIRRVVPSEEIADA